MINGALTIGTLDGANVEMQQACGKDNIFIFGLTTEEVDRLWAQGYNSSVYYANNKKLEKVINALNQGFNGQTFSDIANYLLTGSPIADPYMCLADFGAFCDIHAKADQVYAKKTEWARKSLNNIATAGIFASDRSIREYADRIWQLKRIK
jgi:starch phosphorylase